MSLKVAPTIGPDTTLHCQPSVLDMRKVLTRCFNVILGVSTGIPGIQNILFPEIQEKKFLFNVSRHEKDVRIGYTSTPYLFLPKV